VTPLRSAGELLKAYADARTAFEKPD